MIREFHDLKRKREARLRKNEQTKKDIKNLENLFQNRDNSREFKMVAFNESSHESTSEANDFNDSNSNNNESVGGAC